MIAACAIALSLSLVASLFPNHLLLSLSLIYGKLLHCLSSSLSPLSLLSLSDSSAGHGPWGGATHMEQLTIIAGINPLEMLQISTETDNRITVAI